MSLQAQSKEAEVYLSEREFCERYKINPRSAQRWRTTGDGPKFIRFGPRRVGYRLSDCEAWANKNTFDHRADEMARKLTAETKRDLAAA